MATWQMRAPLTRFKVATTGPPFLSERGFHVIFFSFPLRSEGGPVSFLTQLEGWSYTVARTPATLHSYAGGATLDAGYGLLVPWAWLTATWSFRLR
jgi:hypothetical protein